jgi:hypothetical protein
MRELPRKPLSVLEEAKRKGQRKLGSETTSPAQPVTATHFGGSFFESKH